MTTTLKAKARPHGARRRVIAALGLCTALALSGAAVTGQGAQERKLSVQPSSKQHELSPEVRSRIRQASVAVGLILVRGANEPEGAAPRPRGSAVVVRADGIVATNHHVISESGGRRLYDELYFSLAEGGAVDPASPRHYRLKAIAINREFDLALLSIEAAPSADGAGAPTVFPAVEFGDSRNVQPLEDLFIIGFPEKGGLSITINRGEVEGTDVSGNWIKTDARVIHGNSGGAAVNGEGKLIGIPTKVVADSQAIDRDGDGLPDVSRTYGAVGFLRPAHLVAAMLAQLGGKAAPPAAGEPEGPRLPERPKASAAAASVTLRGSIRSARDKKPIAGALVGVLPEGTESVSADNLLTWGGSNADGLFELRKPLAPGRYTIKVKALGYETFTRDVEVREDSPRLTIEMVPTSK
jgi:S1-C subfamily serine protease